MKRTRSVRVGSLEPSPANLSASLSIPRGELPLRGFTPPQAVPVWAGAGGLMREAARLRGYDARMSTLTALARSAGYDMVAEYRFAPPRRFRADFALIEQRVMIEVDGGVWTRGRHTRGAGYVRDAEKRNLAASMGWLVFTTFPGKELEVWPLVEKALLLRQKGAPDLGS